MSRDPKTPEQDLHPKTAGNDVKDGASASRRPYHAPRVRRLGSVRDLTLGATGVIGDGMAGFMAM